LKLWKSYIDISKAGSNTSPGTEIVSQFLLHDISKIFVLGRSAEEFEDAKRSWDEEKIERVEFVKCDLSDVVDVKRVADALVERCERLDILVYGGGS